MAPHLADEAHPEGLGFNVTSFDPAILESNLIFSSAVDDLRAKFKLVIFQLRPQDEYTIFKDGSDLGIQISYLREKERLGTAGALSLLEQTNDLPLIVMNADVLTKVNFSQFLENHINNQFTTSMCIRKFDFQIPFGVVHVEDHRIVKIEEKPTQSYFVNAGVYILNSECLKLIPKETFFDMPSLFNLVSEKAPSKSGAFPVHEYWIDVGRRDDLNQAQEDFKKVF